MSKFYDYERYVTIYHYDQYDKYFINKENNYYQPAGTGLPAHSTDIPVPEKALPEGYLYVFEDSKWVETEDNFVRIEQEEKNYIYQENLPSTFKIDTILFTDMPTYEEIERFTNPQLQALMLTSKYSHIQHEFIDILDFHDKYIKNIQNSEQFYSPNHNPMIMYRLKTESLMLSIRSLFDELVQLTYVTCYKNDFNNDNKKQIRIDCIGDLFSDSKIVNYPLCKKIILGDENDYEKDKSRFLKTINDLFNSIKHSFLHYESMSLYSDVPNIVSFCKDRNKFSSNKILFLNHSLFQIMFGFQSNFRRIIKNQKKYLLSKN